MAATAGFRQQCPSCEAMVPIKDNNLIGRKIDCPKCKYRFVVEDPDEANDEKVEPGKRPDNGKAAAKVKPGSKRRSDSELRSGRPKKKAGKSTTLMLGVGLAVVALALLGVGAVFLHGNLSKKEDTPLKRAPRAGSAVPDTPKTNGSPNTPTTPTTLADITSLLPADTELVYSLNVEKLLESLLGKAAFETPGAFRRKSFTETLGIPLEDIARLVRAENPGKKWTFNVVRTTKPVKKDDLIKRLGLTIARAQRGTEYYLVPANDLLDGLGGLINPRKDPNRRLGDAPTGAAPLALHVVDAQTVVIADAAILESFLDNGPPKAAPPSAAPPAPAIDSKGKTATTPAPAASSFYMTIPPALKIMMDQLQDGKDSVMLSVATRNTRLDGVFLLRIEELTGFKVPVEARTVASSAQVLGLALQDLKADRLACMGGLGFAEESQAKERAQAVRTVIESPAIAALAQRLGIPWPGASAPPGGKPAPPPRGGTASVTFDRRDKLIFFKVDCPLSQPDVDRLRTLAQPLMINLKGLVEMSAGRSRIHELAAALMAYADKHQRFPRGALLRTPIVEHQNLPWQPVYRLSWMVELLPFLNQAELAERIASVKDKSWRDPEHLLSARTLIPQFLDAAYPESTWWVHYPGVGDALAATHFVGMAGVGLDAAHAGFLETVPDAAKKIGIFSYDRETRLEDIKDGRDKTILVIQVPADYKTPWMAGGGSTVRGVPESNSIRPFICTEYKGRRGTFAIMADGKVRFLAEDIADKDFQALCTINGGEAVDVDKVAPEVPGPASKVELKATAQSQSEKDK